MGRSIHCASFTLKSDNGAEFKLVSELGSTSREATWIGPLHFDKATTKEQWQAIGEVTGNPFPVD